MPAGGMALAVYGALASSEQIHAALVSPRLRRKKMGSGREHTGTGNVAGTQREGETREDRERERSETGIDTIKRRERNRSRENVLCVCSSVCVSARMGETQREKILREKRQR